MEGVVMSTKDLVQYELLKDVLHNKRNSFDVAERLKVSERTIRRRIARIEKHGIRGLVHANKGKTSKNKRSFIENKEILDIISQKYRDFNVCHARDFLFELDNIKISYGSLRKLMMSLGPLKKAKRRNRKQRNHRDRMPRFGMLLQMDGSYHAWNGKDKWCLIAAIDDATSCIPYAEFFDSETTLNCMKLLQKIVEMHGIPDFLYVDRAGLYGGQKRQEFAQFKRACEELGITIIFANSPQAKGRIERAWGTFQDRLIAELSLYGIKEKNEANTYLRNKFLPNYWNKKLTVKPEQSQSAFRAVPDGIDLNDVFSIRFKRNVTGSSTVKIDGNSYRILPTIGEKEIPVCAQVEVIIDQEKNMFAKIRGNRFILKRIKMPPKEEMRCLEPDAQDTESEAHGEGTRLRCDRHGRKRMGASPISALKGGNE